MGRISPRLTMLEATNASSASWVSRTWGGLSLGLRMRQISIHDEIFNHPQQALLVYGPQRMESRE
jgi:hypothetical protein